MILIGVDYHPSVQQVAYVDTETGETCERRLNHSDGEAEGFYRDLKRRQVRVRVGMEAIGHARCLSGCWRSCSSSYGLGTRPRSRQRGYASRRQIGRMRCFYSSY